jgi:dihydrolipoamide dehydrogenase
MGQKSIGVAIVGGGPGGYVAGIRAGQLGLRAMVIEREELGGVCLNWGCIPSKALIHAANLVDELKAFSGQGIKAAIEVNPTELMAWKDGIIKKQRNGIKSLLAANNCEHLRGDARLTGPNTLVVKTGADGGEEEIRFEQLVIATGAKVIELPGFAYDGQFVGFAMHGLAYDPLPKNLVIIGGGVIGSELGMVYAKLGTKVTIVEMLPSILTGTDPDLVKPVLKRMQKLGIEVLTETRSKAAKKGANGAGEVEVTLKDGTSRIIPADKVLVAVGFAANAKALNVEAAGIKTDARGWISVDERCRTNVPHIFAIGDVTGAPLLAHRATKMGEVAVEVIAGKPSAYDVRAMPLGVFTDPEVAQVGLTEAAAREAGYEIGVGVFPTSALGKGAVMHATDGLMKVVVDKKTDVILGVGIAAVGACDLIAEACLALEMGTLGEDLALTVHAHPTLSEGLMEAAKNAHGEAIHIVNRSAERRAARKESRAP